MVSNKLYLTDSKLTGGERTRFIEYHIGHTRQSLQAVPMTDEQTMFGQKTCRCSQGGRRRQRQCTWASNHQQGHHNPQSGFKPTHPPPISQCSQSQQ